MSDKISGADSVHPNEVPKWFSGALNMSEDEDICVFAGTEPQCEQAYEWNHKCGKNWAGFDYDPGWLVAVGFVKRHSNWCFGRHRLEVSLWNNWRVAGKRVDRPRDKKCVLELMRRADADLWLQTGEKMGA